MSTVSRRDVVDRRGLFKLVALRTVVHSENVVLKNEDLPGLEYMVWKLEIRQTNVLGPVA